jgi:hypothetical protein
MCQVITVEVQDERGEREAGPVFWQRPPLPNPDNARFPCLRFVDPYGNTVFNQVQIPVFLDDLRLLLKSHLTEEQVSEIRSIEALIGPYIANPHFYVVLIGD